MRERLYSGHYVLYAYLLTAALLLLAVRQGSLLFVASAAALFAVWDIVWITGPDVVRDRSSEEMNASATRARTYLSYFLGVYGAGTAYFVLNMTAAQRESLLETCGKAGVPRWLLVVPLAWTGITMLFFPIQLKENKAPSTAVRTLIVTVTWSQKIITFTVLFCILRLAYYTSS